MNKLFCYARGYCRIKIEGVASDQVLNRLVKSRVPFWNLQWKDELTLCLCIFSGDTDAVKDIIELCLCEIVTVEYVGIKEALMQAVKRPVFIIGVILSVMMVLVCQNFLLFFEVIGNNKITDDEILRALDTLEINFGVPGPHIKPKSIKNHMLNIMPQLQWITVTQNGSMAQVVVRERTATPLTTERKGFANVVASKAAMITEQSVFEGQALKEPGNFVLPGEMLVSGVVDLETKYIIVRAQAEIFGRTWYQKTVITPEKCLNKEPTDSMSWCIWLEIGKRRIKIFGNSRIYDTDCDKMIVRKNITLPGGYELPAAIMAEKQENFEISELQISKDSARKILQEYAERTVSQGLCAGEILNCEYQVENVDACYRLDAAFTCHEMIAEIVEGKWSEEDFQND